MIRGLSLTRPWPFAFVNGPEEEQKRIENRSWKPPAYIIGQYVALHAAQSWSEEDREFIARVMRLPVPSRAESPHSVVFAAARVAGCIESQQDLRLQGMQREWFFGPYGWLFDEFVALPTPVACKGGQGLWKLETRPGVLEAVREQYALGRWQLVQRSDDANAA